MSKPLPFFATHNDLLQIFKASSVDIQFAFTESGMFEAPVLRTTPLEQATFLGISDTGNHITDKCYLIHDIRETIHFREVPQRNGGSRYSVDQPTNPTTVGIQSGGMFCDDILILGQLGGSTSDPFSEDLAKRLSSQIKRRFSKINSYYVGGEAQLLFDKGARLTINSDAPRDYDLTRL